MKSGAGRAPSGSNWMSRSNCSFAARKSFSTRALISSMVAGMRPARRKGSREIVLIPRPMGSIHFLSMQSTPCIRP